MGEDFRLSGSDPQLPRHGHGAQVTLRESMTGTQGGTSGFSYYSGILGLSGRANRA